MDDQIKSIESLVDLSVHPLSNLANLSAYIRFTLPDINWCGFYFLLDGVLQLGPFCGLPACITIPLGRGVCGTAASEDRTLNVPDVNRFPGHIACDANSRSELVIPLHLDGKVVGVLDTDSSVPDRFHEPEIELLTTAAARIEKSLACNRTIWAL
ncbi:MAG: GAF domain-containing protein [Clostridia bacterium]|nr:GAF domain-containing protein [Clostridia bacterium]